MRRAAVGALSGIGATVVMSGFIAAARAAGMLRTPPPQEITRRTLRKAKVPVTHDFAGRLAWPAHFAYGAALGTVFAEARGAWRRMPPLTAGMTFGAAVWLVSYGGYLPALDLMPPPWRDRATRQIAMIAAHLVYGAALELVVRRLDSGGDAAAGERVAQDRVEASRLAAQV